MLVQVAMWFAQWVIRTVFVLVMLIVRMEMGVNKRFMSM